MAKKLRTLSSVILMDELKLTSPTILNTSNALFAEKKATCDFLNKQFCGRSSSLLCYLRNNSDVDTYCGEVLKEIPAYESKAKVLAAILDSSKRPPKCKICGKHIPYTLVKNKKKIGKSAIFCSSACAMTDEGKRIQVEIYKKNNPVNPMQRAEVREKQRQSVLKKYGVDNVSKLPAIREKANNTNYERYGVHNLFQHEKVKERIVDMARNRHYNTLVTNLDAMGIIVRFTLEEYIERALNHEYMKFECKNCGNVFYALIYNLTSIYCKKCTSPGTSSKKERELYDWLSRYVHCDIGDRTVLKDNKEIDILIRDLNIGVEFDGLYWHSEVSGKDQNYHLDKTEEAASKGIRLIHIFEDEWVNKQNIIKARLKSILGITQYKIYARKCVIKEVDTKLSNKFLNKYHLQGADNSSIRLGLYYKNRLVAIMTFGKPRFNKNYKWELIRYATLSNFNIVGGASKLLAYFRKNFEGNIISYADRRFSEGNLYKVLKFKHLKNSRPNYFYTKNDKRLSRYKCQKHKLKSLLGDNYDNNLSEYLNMIKNNYYKIWDCGNMVFTLDN